MYMYIRRIFCVNIEYVFLFSSLKVGGLSISFSRLLILPSTDEEGRDGLLVAPFRHGTRSGYVFEKRKHFVRTVKII